MKSFVKTVSTPQSWCFLIALGLMLSAPVQAMDDASSETHTPAPKKKQITQALNSQRAANIVQVDKKLYSHIKSGNYRLVVLNEEGSDLCFVTGKSSAPAGKKTPISKDAAVKYLQDQATASAAAAPTPAPAEPTPAPVEPTPAPAEPKPAEPTPAAGWNYRKTAAYTGLAAVVAFIVAAAGRIATCKRVRSLAVASPTVTSRSIEAQAADKRQLDELNRFDHFLVKSVRAFRAAGNKTGSFSKRTWNNFAQWFSRTVLRKETN